MNPRRFEVGSRFGAGRFAGEPLGSWARTALPAMLVAAAASVHVVLTPDHFREGPQFGWFFLGASLYQWWLAFALILWPGPPVYRAGLWGSAALVVTWMGTRLVPPPGAPAPEPVEVWGVVATGLEIAAVVTLAATLPSPGSPPGTLKRRVLAGGAGLGFAALVLLASGVVTPIPSGRWSGPTFLLRNYPLGSWRLDGVWVVVAGRWSAIVPWLTLGFAAFSASLVGWTVSLGLRLGHPGRCSARRRTVLAALPASATVPVCCGAPLTAFAGGAAVGALFRWTPWLMGLSLLLLAVNVMVLRRRLRGDRPISKEGR